MKNKFKRTEISAFTLIELLVVIAIIAILSIVVVLTLNPAALLQQSRDANRISDLATMNSALGIYAEDQSLSSLGSSTIIYVSLPDPAATSTAGDQCQGLGLPTLPSLYAYHCAASSTFRNTNSFGWIPVNLSTISLGSPLSQLPVDPINQSSSRLYYTYTTNGTQFELTSGIESAKYKLGGSNDVIGPDGATLSSVYAKGSNLSLEPLDYGDPSLVGLWSFNEGTGTIAYDYSGNNATGSWNGTQAGSNGYYAPGKIGPWAGAFDGNNDQVSTTYGSYLDSANITIAMWIYPTSNSQYGTGISRTNTNECPNSIVAFKWRIASENREYWMMEDSGCTLHILNTSIMPTNQWSQVAFTYNGSLMSAYINGLLNATGSTGFTPEFVNSTSSYIIGSAGTLNEWFPGLMDDVRIYNRALSASEIAAMYVGGK